MTIEQKKIFTVTFLLAMLILIATAFLAGHRVGSDKSASSRTTIKTETKTIIDTTFIEKPVYVDRYFKDSIIVVINDTILVHDTTYMYLPREYKVYQDSSYRAVVSGFEPRLDSIETYNATKIVAIETAPPSKPRSRWSISIHAGYGMSREGLSPTLSAGVSYSLVFLGR